MANSNPNQDNLIPFNEMDKDKRREIAVKGAEATNTIRRQKKTMREMINEISNVPVPETWKERMRANDFSFVMDAMNSQDITLQAAAIFSMYNEAIINGNVKALEFLRDTMGEKPVDKVQMDTKIEKSPIDSLTAELFEGEDNAKT